tara:strand:+ start:1175 stop:1816 length:642 start_codon:yes stop_codon:yes gene_type:complete
MKNLILIPLCFIVYNCFSQAPVDIFTTSDYNYTYLGIDYSHSKFNGDFSQFNEAGTKGFVTIKSEYFTAWNGVVYNEQEKYNLKDALRKEHINYELEDVRLINENTVVENMEGSTVTFSKSDIQEFINNSKYTVTDGIGIMFIAEYLDKNRVEACFHFVMINMISRDVLIHERIVNKPGGFGLRNYWIRPVFLSIEKIRKSLYKGWQKEYVIK